MKLKILALIVAITACLPLHVYSQGQGAHVRISDGPNAAFHGGGSSALIGVNSAGINNWGINVWGIGLKRGETVTAASVSFEVFRGILNSNVHGSDLDTISIHEIYNTNSGWRQFPFSDFRDGVHTQGGPTFNLQQQLSNTGQPWRDENGADLANFLGAFDPTPIDTVPGYNIGAEPATVEFNIPLPVAQRWIDNSSSAGLVLASNDNGDGIGRFLFGIDSGFLTIDSVRLGDVGQNGIVNFLDIPLFISVLAEGEFQAEADLDQNGVVNFLDIAPFIQVLSE